MKKILISSLTVILMASAISMALPSVHAAEIPGWIRIMLAGGLVDRLTMVRLFQELNG